MRVQFIQKQNGPERLVSEAEVLFDEEPLAGLKLVGFCLWSSPDGEIYVTFPPRAFGAGSERKYFDYLRSTDGTAHAVKRFKAYLPGPGGGLVNVRWDDGDVSGVSLRDLRLEAIADGARTPRTA